MPRYLTKSRFKLGCECPAKLFYTSKQGYKDRSLEDTFLQALAEGGYQVGELAKLTFPGGYDIKTLKHDEAVEQTNALLEQDQVTIYEAAIRHDNLFIRADVLVKDGNRLSLYEVKAKSIDSTEDPPFYKRSGEIKKEWLPYLQDVAFQKHVLRLAFPQAIIQSHLVLVDKSVPCPVDGLNQYFPIRQDENGRFHIEVLDTVHDKLIEPSLLYRINVDQAVEQIWGDSYELPVPGSSFEQWVNTLSLGYAEDRKLPFDLSTECKNCQFKAKPDERAAGDMSGFHECWTQKTHLDADTLDQPTILDIWNFRQTQDLLDQGKYLMDQVKESDIDPDRQDSPGLSTTERRWLQVDFVQRRETQDWIDQDGLGQAIDQWSWPLNLIDFETSMVAIPFNQGRKPYEQAAFQFSHHLLHEDGRVEHANEYLHRAVGEFPNYYFIRALKNALSTNKGSVFRYATHENTVLNQIHQQLVEDEAPPADRDELCEFIRSISHSRSKSTTNWIGDRDMIDLRVLVLRHWYAPKMKGSNSLKFVLPAMLHHSEWLQQTYSQPIYGAEGGIPSKNFRDMQWLQIEDGQASDPYRMLPPLFTDLSEDENELLNEDEIADGGAAMTAYARMQFEAMPEAQRQAIQDGLLRYCELDTLAMVMLIQGWQDRVGLMS